MRQAKRYAKNKPCVTQLEQLINQNAKRAKHLSQKFARDAHGLAQREKQIITQYTKRNVLGAKCATQLV